MLADTYDDTIEADDMAPAAGSDMNTTVTAQAAFEMSEQLLEKMGVAGVPHNVAFCAMQFVLLGAAATGDKRLRCAKCAARAV